MGDAKKSREEDRLLRVFLHVHFVNFAIPLLLHARRADVRHQMELGGVAPRSPSPHGTIMAARLRGLCPTFHVISHIQAKPKVNNGKDGRS
jgi:hypothetical protein